MPASSGSKKNSAPTAPGTPHKAATVAIRKKPLRSRDFAFWRAYIEILNERVPLVDRWSDGTTTWHPRVVRKMLWYTETPDTMPNRHMAIDWLMEHVAVYTDDKPTENTRSLRARRKGRA